MPQFEKMVQTSQSNRSLRVAFSPSIGIVSSRKAMDRTQNYAPTWVAMSLRELRQGGLFQLRVLRLGCFENGDVGVGIFPEGEEVLVGYAALGLVALKRKGAGQAELGQGH